MGKEWQNKVLLVTAPLRALARLLPCDLLRQAQVSPRSEGTSGPCRNSRIRSRSARAQLLSVPADLSHEGETESVVAKTVERFGGIDVLVNAAGHISSGT